MYLLPCPECQQAFEVSPSQAGDNIACPSCRASVPIPKLGELRQLPTSAPAADDDHSTPASADTSGRQVASVILGMVALAGFLIGGYAAIRWYLVKTPITTEIHIANTEEAYLEAPVAQLIREYEAMEEKGLDLPAMYNYKSKAIEKSGWALTAAISAGLAAVAAAIATMLASTGRSTKT